jgi:hypothetical protein
MGEYTIWIEAEVRAPGSWDPADANSDVTVTFADGSRWFATVVTYRNVITLAERRARTGESFGGRYFWIADLLLLDALSRERIEEVIAHTLANGEFAAIFMPDVSAGGGADEE